MPVAPVAGLVLGNGGAGGGGGLGGRAGLFIGEPSAGWVGNTGGPGQSVVIEFVRHAQSVANAQGYIDTAVPGVSITAPGQLQALVCHRAFRAGPVRRDLCIGVAEDSTDRRGVDRHVRD